MWARFGVVAFSVCRHVGDVAHSTSHEPTRSGMEPDVKKFVGFLVGNYVWGWPHFPCIGTFVMWLIRPHTSPRGAGWSPT